MLYHVVATVVILTASILFIISTEQIRKLEKLLKSEAENGNGESLSIQLSDELEQEEKLNFRRSKKLTAGVM